MSVSKRSSLLGSLMPAERVAVLFPADHGSGALS
jgi:hypothetical protein